VWFANIAHEKCLGAALENDLWQSTAMDTYFDRVIFELDRDDTRPCLYGTGPTRCSQFDPFVQASKAVMVFQYGMKRQRFCELARQWDFNGIRKGEISEPT
jgi:hypothetical protein